MDTLFKISIAIVAGLIGGRIARLLKLPNVTGYLVAGLLVGTSFMNLITTQDVQAFSVISEFALAIIAFSIGSEFVIKEMRKLGKSIIIITISEVIGAIAVVFGVMYYLFNQPFAFSIVIAAMSAATAPAATLMVIKQYKAHGPLTRTILPVVALDDIVGIIAFGIAISLAKLPNGIQGVSLFETIKAPSIEIVGSLILGLIIGLILTFLAKRATDKDELLIITLGTIALTTGVANFLTLSPLLSCIMVGTTLVNLFPNYQRVFGSINDFSPPIYLLFFTLAGASLDLSILTQVGLIGLAYIIARASGKIIGAWIGTKIAKTSKTVSNNLGLALLPQGGVSIGLSIIVRQQLPEYSVAITTIIMFSVLVYEISGPIFAKIAIQRAGEINGAIENKDLSLKKGEG